MDANTNHTQRTNVTFLLEFCLYHLHIAIAFKQQNW